MNVVCNYNSPCNAPLGTPEDFNLGLELYKEYLVMGIMTNDEGIWYLLDESKKPDFYPIQLFKISNPKLTSGWYFRINDEDNGIYPFGKKAIWSYYELCFLEKHYENLIDREKSALKIYFNRKEEVMKNTEIVDLLY